jgi:hypothetical protein
MTQDYTTLQTAVFTACELDPTQNSDTANYFPIAVNIAEERLTRDLDMHGLTVYTTVQATGGSAFVNLPSGTRAIKSIYRVSASGALVPLYQRTDEFCKMYWPIRTSTARPKYYAPWGAGVILLTPTPSASDNLEFSVIMRPSALSSVSQTTNYFTQFTWNALFFAVMCEMSGYMKNSSMVQQWDTKYKDELRGLGIESKRSRRDDQNQPMAPQRENTLDGVL